MFEHIIETVREKTPLVHNITNYVTVNDCANIILACGGSPIMADDEAEVEEITSICNALVINIGTLNHRTVESMILAGKRANAIGIPVVLDPVGAGASKLRTQTTMKLLEQVRFSVIRGNSSEMKTIALGSGTTKGVDADAADSISEENLQEAIHFVQTLSKTTGAVIAMTGAVDLVADEKQTYVIRNGHPMMSKITGTGCMLSAMTGAFCGANPTRILEAVACAVSIMGLAGELGWDRTMKTDGGSSSLRMHLIDYISKMDTAMLNGGMKLEIR
jgi:hydroxyethylthiazole kinase